MVEMRCLNTIWEDHHRGWSPTDARHRHWNERKKYGHFLNFCDGEVFGEYRLDFTKARTFHDSDALSDSEFHRRYKKLFLRNYDIVVMRISWAGLKLRLVENIDESQHFTFSNNYTVIRPKMSSVYAGLLESGNVDEDVLCNIEEQLAINAFFLMASINSVPVREEFARRFGRTQSVKITEFGAMQVPYPEASVRKDIAMAYHELYDRQSSRIVTLLNQRDLVEQDSAVLSDIVRQYVN